MRFPLKIASGPRNGHMKEYFEVGDDVPGPGTERICPTPAARTMIVPAPETESAKTSGPDWWRRARNMEGPDRLEAMEAQI